MDKRRWPRARPALASSQIPLSSGPRWVRVAVIRLILADISSAGAAALASRKPASPHIRHCYLFIQLLILGRDGIQAKMFSDALTSHLSECAALVHPFI